jgi:hypothetical protein
MFISIIGEVHTDSTDKAFKQLLDEKSKSGEI